MVLALEFRKMMCFGKGNGKLTAELGGQGLKVASGSFESSPKCSLDQSPHSASTAGSQSHASSSLERKGNEVINRRFSGSRSKPRMSCCCPLLPRLQEPLLLGPVHGFWHQLSRKQRT